MLCPWEDNVKRHRAKLNEQGLYLSDKPEVLKARKQSQEKWLKELNYNYKPNLWKYKTITLIGKQKEIKN